MLRRSEFKIGEFLTGDDGRTFIHDGYVNGDGYGIVIGEHEGKIKKSNEYGNWQYGSDVRIATDEEKEALIVKIHRADKITDY